MIKNIKKNKLEKLPDKIPPDKLESCFIYVQDRVKKLLSKKINKIKKIKKIK